MTRRSLGRDWGHPHKPFPDGISINEAYPITLATMTGSVSTSSNNATFTAATFTGSVSVA